jgi:hypothetical protein
LRGASSFKEKKFKLTPFFEEAAQLTAQPRIALINSQKVKA